MLLDNMAKAKIPKYLQELIDQREGLKLDFKFEVSDLRKIARSIVAFANTDGGILLIGVKDNGRIAGVQSDEELYMIQAAARMYCRPAVDFYFRPWKVGDKTVLEINIPRSPKRPHYARVDSDKWKAFIRVKDKVFAVNNVQLRVWKDLNNQHRRAVHIDFQRREDLLLDYLRTHEFITFKKFCQIAKLTPKVAEDVLVDLILIDVIEIQYTDDGIARYVAKNSPAGELVFG